MTQEKIARTAAEEQAARRACFVDCSHGAHLDPEAGCVTVCRSESDCQGWVPYLRAQTPDEGKAALVAGIE